MKALKRIAAVLLFVPCVTASVFEIISLSVKWIFTGEFCDDDYEPILIRFFIWANE